MNWMRKKAIHFIYFLAKNPKIGLLSLLQLMCSGGDGGYQDLTTRRQTILATVAVPWRKRMTT